MSNLPRNKNIIMKQKTGYKQPKPRKAFLG